MSWLSFRRRNREFAALVLPARGEDVLRIAMTASDIPTTTGMPNNGFEGMRFLGYPIFEGLVLWDLARADRLAGLRPGLAETYEQAPDDKKTWIFHLRRGVKFHDGTDFNADAVIWNLDRYFKNDSPQFEPPAAGMTRARVPVMGSYRKIDDLHGGDHHQGARVLLPLSWRSTSCSPRRPRSRRPGATGDASRRCRPPAPGRSASPRCCRGKSPSWPASTATGTRPTRPRSTCIRLLPIPEANSRLAALRSGQVDWIEVPPPDGIPSLKAAGFTIVTNSYPHVWPWMYNIGAANSPFKDVRVRQALNYCIDRSGLVTLAQRHGGALGRLAQAEGCGLRQSGEPLRLRSRQGQGAARGSRLHGAEAAVVQGDDLDLRLRPDAAAADERVPAGQSQAGLRRQCRVRRGGMAGAAQRRPATPDSPALHGAMALNVSSPSSDVGIMARYFSSANFSPNGFNFEQWKDDKFDAALATLAECDRPGHDRGVVPRRA